MVEPYAHCGTASADDAHRKLDKQQDLTAILSYVRTPQVKGNYTVPFAGRHYVLEKSSICTGLRGARVRVEQRLDGSIAMCFKDRYLTFKLCTEPVKTAAAAKSIPPKDDPTQRAALRQKSPWMKGFFDKPSPSMNDAIRIANATS